MTHPDQFAAHPNIRSDTTPAELLVHTDGAAKGNPGPAGWAWWIGPNWHSSGGFASATNNVAELTAVAQALTHLSHLQGTRLVIVTDSTYVRDACTKWIHAWRNNGWKTRSGTDVANAELIRRIDTACRAHGNVQWRWVRGHSGHPGNEQADALASAAAHRARTGDVHTRNAGTTAGSQSDADRRREAHSGPA